jgi:hypothetical protein
VGVPLVNALWRRCAVTGIYTWIALADCISTSWRRHLSNLFHIGFFSLLKNLVRIMKKSKASAASVDLLLRRLYVNLVDQSAKMPRRVE